MRWLVLFFSLVVTSVVTLAVSSAAQGKPMGFDDARELLYRTGFSADEADVQHYAGLSRLEAVNRILDQTNTLARTPAPDWASEAFSIRKFRALPEEDRKQLVKQEIQKGIELRSWWYQEMRDTPTPLTEKMTLFWHNHFVSSIQKVKFTPLMYQQNALLRKYALGNFGDMLHAVAKDPAMLIYLDGVSNRKGKPNENFAREVMELFTLGIGHYTEQDVKEAARAFSGWAIDLDSGQFRNYPFLHDGGDKTFLGRTGKFNGDDILDILLAQPETAEFITNKVWREFISPNPDPKEVKRIAAVFRNSRYDIKSLMRAVLTSNAFYANNNRGSLVKSPVELMVGTLRQFNIPLQDMRILAFAGRQLGQDIFAPPNVKGWPGGDDWINSNTLLLRKQLLERVFRGQEMPGSGAMMSNAANQRAQKFDRAASKVRFDDDRWLQQFKGDDARKNIEVARLVLALPPVTPPQPDMASADYVRALVLDPAYQLK